MSTLVAMPQPNLSIVLPLLLITLAVSQPPRPNGRGKEFLTPRSQDNQTSNICGSLLTRELNGKCTSTRNPTWGQARFAQFSYLSRSTSSVPSGRGLLSAREISNIVFDQRSDTVNSHGLNQLFVFFGQFLDHNIVATPENDKERLDIPVPPSDRFLSGKTLPFKRSIKGSADSGRSVRPINTLSSAVDLVGVYGPNDVRNNAVLEFDQFDSVTGSLKTSSSNLLPLNDGNFVNSPDTTSRFFLAGDHRSNENPVLTAIHTIFLREHNYLADQIRKEIPSLPGRLVYEYARLMNVAQYQKIVFEEFYPAIIGKPLPSFEGFRHDVNPTLSDIFIGAAFRIGHTMIGNEIPRRGPNGPLRPLKMTNIFFRPASTFTSTELDNVVRGTANARAQEVDARVVDALRNFLFKSVRGEDGFDLVALNIQRGRDHALPNFNDIRAIFNIPKARTFRDITTDDEIAGRLSRAYNGNVNDVEAFPGLLAEDRVPGSGMGRTMVAVWESEFRRLRDGDQYFYLRTARFPEILRQELAVWVQKLQTPGEISFKDVLLRNSGIKASQVPPGNIFSLTNIRQSATPVPKPPVDGRLCTSEVCCPASCGVCGGTGCGERPGGQDNCCVGSILASGRKCNGMTSSSCIIQAATGERPICTNEVCCPASCGKCAGDGCNERPGGFVNCCASGILQSGRKCGGETISACILAAITNERPICTNEVCCPASCGTCGGIDCGLRRQGVVNCCASRILESGRKCGGSITSACIIAAITNENPICTTKVCCPASCGNCAESDCGQLSAGVVNCCGNRIIESGRKCGGDITSACIIP